MSKPTNLVQYTGPRYFKSLYKENLVESTASSDNRDYVTPKLIKKNCNDELMANYYDSTGDFYFISGSGRPQTNYLQIVSEGSLTYNGKMSIDCVNWSTASPTAISGSLSGGNSNAPVNVVIPIGATPAGLHYKISTSSVTGNYYINLLN